MPHNFPEEEEKILKLWEENHVFEKSLEQTKKGKPFVFYDGPPFATGLPHYGHILSSVIKDVVPRYKTMRGFYVRRRWGWDCHGLPIENLVEKEIGVSSKKDIEEKIGVAKFNSICRSKVQMYVAEWRKMVRRIARWVDFDNSYKTMDSSYMESVWWALKTLWDKGLIYEGKKVLMYCPHCETPVSKAEVAMDNHYRDITEEAVTVKFKVISGKFQGAYLLAWTTTPWTLPGNVALAVGDEIEYALVAFGNERYILAASCAAASMKGKNYKIERKFSGTELIGLKYEPLYEIKAAQESGKKGWYVASADFVNIQEGTGIVHTAVIYGEDDYNLGVRLDLPMVQLLDSKGVFNEEAPALLRGKYFKTAEKTIKDDLHHRGLLFSKEQHTHSYPFCWRCETQLLYNAVSAWFINIQKNKKRIIELNEKIEWYPEHLKHGRFLNILEGAPDWNISRNRYWATPLPFFVCEKGHHECIGSLKELKKRAINFSDVFNSDEIEKIDIHKENMDKVRLKCRKCKKEMVRVPEVIDCWVESASMPFAELHYPFENKALFKKRFPGQYIAEYIAQTRTWFYYMHVMGALLFDSVAFENVVTTGTVLNEKGEKMSKSRKNFPDPWEIINRYGMDALRFYLMSSPVMAAEDLFFDEREVKEARNKIINTIVNVVEFYQTYADKQAKTNAVQPRNVLDKWIISKLNHYVRGMTWYMDEYNTVKSCRIIKEFVEDLSLWYVRRSRARFKPDTHDKKDASHVLGHVLSVFAKTIAPILPFTAEMIFSSLKTGHEISIHLSPWPTVGEYTDLDLEHDMDEVRNIVAMALAERAAALIKVRQPLQKLKVKSLKLKDKSEELLDLIKDEVNVKEILFSDESKDGVKLVELDTVITPELKEEGIMRELVRAAQEFRKELGLKPENLISLWISGDSYVTKTAEKNKELIAKETRSRAIIFEESSKEGVSKKEVVVNGEKVFLAIKT